MLKFIDKQGKKVMEMNDNGDVNVLSENLKISFSTEPLKEESKKEEKYND